ncbi:MAG: glutamine synthetase [Candidatus Latescibacterota bacterium]|nr:MAG: glutamine synthetase [Candidatus Latescibacterota bacterium]
MKQRYALTNPIAPMLGKSRDDFTREDLVKVIEEKDIEKITLHYVALDGQLKELKIPFANRYQAERILADGERVDGSSLFKGVVDVGQSDLYVVPVYKTAFLNPFDGSSLDFVCRYLTPDGELAPYTMDNILLKAYRTFRRNSGLEIYALGEIEFFLVGEPASPIFPARSQGGYHASAPFVKSGPILDEMVRCLTQVTGAVKYAHSEVGHIERIQSASEELNGKQAEQMEIELFPTPIDETGDNVVLARWLIRNIAYRHGCVATFAPKIEEGVAGNGLHFHVELMDNNHNVMSEDTGGLSLRAKRLIGGLCEYADSLTAFGNTVSSAYLRLVPNQEAPTRICWSDMNRSAMIRVPLAWSKVSDLSLKLNPQQKSRFQRSGNRQAVELRSPDGSALVHLLLAGMTMAADWAMEDSRSLDLAEKLYVTGDLSQNPKLAENLPSLPASCVESSRILLEKRHLYERDDIFPSGVIDYIAASLAAEDDENLNKYLADLPKETRSLEARKAMHKDVHCH